MTRNSDATDQPAPAAPITLPGFSPDFLRGDSRIPTFPSANLSLATAPDEPAEPPPDLALDLSDTDFLRIRNRLHKESGIFLSDQKKTLVAARLRQHLLSLGFHSFTDYVRHLEQAPSPELIQDLANRLATNHSYFYREPRHFEFLTQTALPEITAKLAARNDFDLRIWSAACAAGEEAYTLAMLVADFLGNQRPRWQAGLLATDLSSKALQLAHNATYHTDLIRDLPTQLRDRYMSRISPTEWRIKPELKNQVTFRRLNLVRNEPFPFRKPFQIIFCRNVMIYFDPASVNTALRAFHACMEPGAYLFIGHTESLGRDRSDFQYISPAIYKRI